mgnify:CR=1 FL=1
MSGTLLGPYFSTHIQDMSGVMGICLRVHVLLYHVLN